ncbi:hypothetical protein LSH36_17g00045 [Paralvinella palmiformis]|uniref:GRIP domain-containing protein n=1 Tax=Paralvinella palmiformis TaxID=53620 RepID=A0AAD9NFQ1_9ANNE|nr:hypothetical protein LSH36_17g00045 [Paralvinella palmiformis]
MSSWFGTGLSHITGQISNFTKEVLEEGVEEVDDVATRLKITRNKFVELDGYCQAQKSEIERLKAANDELQEKLEATELQVKTLSNEYRVIIESKEEELKSLKHQQNELYSKPLEVSPGTSPTESSIPHSLSMPSLRAGLGCRECVLVPSRTLVASAPLRCCQGDEHDFDDVISSQHEINRLRTENSRLEAEVRHWNQRLIIKITIINAVGYLIEEDVDDLSFTASWGAVILQTSRVAGGDSDRIHELQKQIKELQQQYDDEIDQHQRELAVLQDVHAQKLSTIKHKNKEELGHLHEELDELRDKVSDNTECNPKVLRNLTERVQHLEEVNQKLTFDLELTHAADREKARCLDELTRQLEVITQERDELKSQYQDLQQEKQELMDQLDAVVSEQRRITALYGAKQRDHHNAAVGDVQNTSAGPSHPEHSYVSSTPMRHGKRPSSSQLLDSSDLSDIQGDADLASDVSELSRHNVELDNQVTLLRKQISAYEDEIKQFEMVKSDWQMEKEALEDVLLNMREQLRDRDEKITALQQQRDSHEMKKPISSEEYATQSGHNLALESLGNTELYAEYRHVKSERDGLIQRVKKLEEELKHYQTKHAEEVDALHQQMMTLEQQLSTKVSIISELKESLKNRETELSALSSGLGENMAVLEEKAELLKVEQDGLDKVGSSEKSAVDVAGEMDHLRRQLRESEEEKTTLRSELKERNSDIQIIGDEKTKLNEEKAALSTEIKSLFAKKGELVQKLAEVLEENEKIKNEMVQVKEEQNGLNDSLEELDAQHEAAMSQIIETRDRLAKENAELKSRITTLEAERKQEREQLKDVHQLADDFVKLKTEQEKVSVKLTEIQLVNEQLSDNRVTLEEEKALLTNQLHQMNKERINLHQNCDKLQEEADSTTAELATLRDRLSSLEVENANLRQSTASLEEQLQEASSASGTCQLEHHRVLEEELVQLKELHSSQISELSSRVDALQELREKAQRDLAKAELRAAEQKQLFEQYREELKGSRQLDDTSLQAEYERLVALLQEKDQSVNSLKRDLDVVQTELSTSEESLNQLTKEKDKQQQELERLALVEEQYIEACKENKMYQTKIEGSWKEPQPSPKSKTHSISEDEVDSLEQKCRKQEMMLEEQSKEFSSLKDKLGKYEDEIAQLKQENVHLFSKTDELTKRLIPQDATDGLVRRDHLVNGDESNSLEKTDSSLSNREKLKWEVCDRSVVKCANVMQNGDIGCDPFHSSSSKEELEKMKSIVTQKDYLITQLNDNNSSLLKLLEERSQAMYGDQTLVDIHRLENEVRDLRAEKDQIMSILNEKTRECSSLKSEVHRLMNVISAEKTALSKLQQDNQDLIRSKDDPREDPWQEMKQEAIKKLSQIIRDKDMEIEALSQKNQTLLQVLQDSAQEGSQILALMHEKDNLVQQIGIFQKDREQIISMLNAKHLESVGYHEEIQRLNKLLALETSKHEQLQTEHASLKNQYEDKQHALVKMQNEMLNYKKKYTEMEMHFKESKIQKARPGCNAQSSLKPASETLNVMTAHDDESNSLSAEVAEELEDLRLIIKSHEDSFAEKDKIIHTQNQSLKDKDRTIWERDTTLTAKDRQLAELHAKVHKAEENVHSKDSELNNLRKQSDNLSFQLKGIQVDCHDLRQERDQLYERSSVLQQELGSLKEANNRLTMTLHSREFEIHSLNEKVNTLSKLAETKGEGTKDEMQRVMKDMEEQQQQAQAFKQERDQSVLAIQQQQVEIQQLRNEIQRLKERGGKSAKELERLRGHLLSIEENYTQDALAAEEREKELRNKLAVAEEKALSSSTAVQAANQQALRQVESLQTQLHVMAEQRDDALLQLSNAQETANQYQTSLQNLQMVLEQFQMERETQQNTEIEKYQKDIAGYKSEIARLQDQVRQLQAQLDETVDALEAAQRLSEQLDHKEEMIAALREEVQLRESELMKMEAEIEKLSSSTEGKVDKVLMKNLILGYFHTPASSRGEALRLIGRMLDFSKPDMEQLGLEGGRGWLGGLFKKTNPTPPSTPQASPNKSFSELFVNFLERESTPQPNLRLPTDRMVAESQHRHLHSHQTPTSRSQPAFNPFSAPVNSTLPLHIGKDPEGQGFAVPSHHPLIKPVNSSLPLLTTAIPESSSSLLMAPSGGHTMNSGAILRDVLQQ